MLNELHDELIHRMQWVVFICYFVAEAAGSGLFYLSAPLNPICVWYPNFVMYLAEHLIGTVAVIASIAIGWWFIGNMAYWESICRSHQRVRMLAWGGVWGVGIDLVSSLLVRNFSPRASEPHYVTGDIWPWLLMRTGIWLAEYIIAAVIMHSMLRPQRHSIESMNSN